MAPRRTGTLVPKASGFFGRLRLTLPNGAEERRWINLQTKDRTTARRKLARMVALLETGELVAEAQVKATAPETYQAYSSDLHKRRLALGIVMADDEQNNRRKYIYPVLGHLPLTRVTDDHVRQVLEDARDQGLAWETVRKIRAVMSRDFKRARLEKLVQNNPVQDVALPARLKRDKRPRTILTDAEIEQFLAAKDCDLELKMLSLVARSEGGMRTAELVRWDWAMIDTAAFAACTIARAKTGDVQTLEVPEMLRPFLRAWWKRSGAPRAGPVFPVRRGPRVGLAKNGHNTSFAKPLRRELAKAGVFRLPPVVDAATNRASPNASDPIYFDTPISKRADFHSFRRAYNTALARAGVNLQQAMVLASHSDPKTHMGYVMAAEATRPLPLAALPQIDPALARSIWSPNNAQSQGGTPNQLGNTGGDLDSKRSDIRVSLQHLACIPNSPSKPRVAGSSPAGRAWNPWGFLTPLTAARSKTRSKSRSKLDRYGFDRVAELRHHGRRHRRIVPLADAAGGVAHQSIARLGVDSGPHAATSRSSAVSRARCTDAPRGGPAGAAARRSAPASRQCRDAKARPIHSGTPRPSASGRDRLGPAADARFSRHHFTRPGWFTRPSRSWR
jgi:integrase